jgi:hypothetical protein
MPMIQYGIGADYLPNWTVEHALREIFQNYIDYGEYNVHTEQDTDGNVTVFIRNNYIPENLEFLRIGNSNKTNKQIGKWGEGLKMAFLVMLRESIPFTIISNKHTLKAIWVNHKEIGNILAINYQPYTVSNNQFITKFTMKADVFFKYMNGIITKQDILFEHSYHGRVVNKDKGNIYCNGIFVCNVENMSKAYDLYAEVLPLDRDRVLPKTWDVNYHTSKLNEAYDKWTTKDLSYSDASYIQKIPERYHSSFRPRRIDKTIYVEVKHEDGTTELISNSNIKDAVKELPYFKRKLKQLMAWMSRGLSHKQRLIAATDKIKNNITTEDYNQIINLINEL